MPENFAAEKQAAPGSPAPTPPPPAVHTDRYVGLPVVFIVGPDGAARPAPFLLGTDDAADLFRLREQGVKHVGKALARYRRLGLRAVRVGKRRWFRLDDALRFLDAQQERVG